MPEGKIKTEIECKNIAPLIELKKSISAESIQKAIFANNGSGKTFISRVFRLTENKVPLEMNSDGTSPIDKLITKGLTSGHFKFKITDKEGNVKEDLILNFNKGSIPTIPQTHYIYHTFNQDYVEENIRALSFEKDSEIEGFILGKANIDLHDEEAKLAKIGEDGKKLRENLNEALSTYLEEKINDIQNIKRLTEYSQITVSNIIKTVKQEKNDETDSYQSLIEQYNKIKSVPEVLADINLIPDLQLNLEVINDIKDDCIKEFELSTLAEEFKQKVKSKQQFIELGLELKKDNCPFCEQDLQDKALTLIDDYNNYIKDQETTTIKKFNYYKEVLESYKSVLKESENIISKITNKFNTYKTKYIASSADKEILAIDSSEIIQIIDELIELIDEQLIDISKSVDVKKDYKGLVVKEIGLYNNSVSKNNQFITELNTKKNKINDENKRIRKLICKAALSELSDENIDTVESMYTLSEEHKKLSQEIKFKKELEKVSKKEKVATAIKSILNYFFSDKYELDADTFRLKFLNTILEKGEVKNVLSEGEKNIIAFAYYIGDTHLKIETEDDYKKLFFIIDDPISSMDFNHVYTLCGVIRDLSSVIDKLERVRYIILTHNNDFMRVLTTNNIVKSKLLLKNSKLYKFNNNITVPYINHMIDIYGIARNGKEATHTTANSIRHIIETLTKFEKIDLNNSSIESYITENIPSDKKSYTMINDLSHGGWRSEQAPLTNDDYQDVCETVIALIENKYSGQVEYCKKMNE